MSITHPVRRALGKTSAGAWLSQLTAAVIRKLRELVLCPDCGVRPNFWACKQCDIDWDEILTPRNKVASTPAPQAPDS